MYLQDKTEPCFMNDLMNEKFQMASKTTQREEISMNVFSNFFLVRVPPWKISDITIFAKTSSCYFVLLCCVSS